jgi:hypothetical protein
MDLESEASLSGIGGKAVESLHQLHSFTSLHKDKVPLCSLFSARFTISRIALRNQRIASFEFEKGKAGMLLVSRPRGLWIRSLSSLVRLQAQG